MSDRRVTLEELTELLGRLRPERAGARNAAQVTDAQIQLLLSRMAALTDALRGAQPDDTARLASRLVLDDLASVASQFRGRTNDLRELLAKALADLRDARSEAMEVAPEGHVREQTPQ